MRWASRASDRTAAAKADPRQASSPGALRQAALRLLARREHARSELELRLSRRGGDAADIAAVLDALERDGYLSDARLANALVAQKAGRYGKRAIAHALRERGVDGDATREALDALAGRDEIDEARTLLARRFPDAPHDDRERARQLRFLIGRGYALPIALKVVRDVSGSPRRRREEPTGES
jgi:regulatory protein